MPMVGLGTSALTITALDASDGSALHVTTWSDWMSLLRAVAGSFMAETVVPRENFGIGARDNVRWYQIRRNGDYALELGQLLEFDNTFGARLVMCNGGAVLHYQPVTATNQVVVSAPVTVTATMPVMTDDMITRAMDEMMDVDAVALASMDAAETDADARYNASYDRETRELWYDLE